jgi:hypothetical protein
MVSEPKGRYNNSHSLGDQEREPHLCQQSLVPTIGKGDDVWSEGVSMLGILLNTFFASVSLDS